MKLSVEVKAGSMIPRWCGVAYYDFQIDRQVCYPVPLNLIARWVRNVSWWLRAPGHDVRYEEWYQGYQAGYEKACESCICEISEEVDLMNEVSEATQQPEWIRQGECNQCGDCCRQATNLVTLSVPIADEAYGRVRYGEPVGRVEQLGGIPIFQIRGPLLLPCPKLDGDRCSIHDTKPDYCRDRPSFPEDIDGLPRCSYWFVHRETGEIRGPVPAEAGGAA